jgi:F0F1-type ATP synthase assembly protein I
MEELKRDMDEVKAKLDKIYRLLIGDKEISDEGLIKRHNNLDAHVDTEIRALNGKVDDVIEDQKKWKWIAVGFSAAGTFFGSIIGWFVERGK